MDFSTVHFLTPSDWPAGKPSFCPCGVGKGTFDTRFDEVTCPDCIKWIFDQTRPRLKEREWKSS